MHSGFHPNDEDLSLGPRFGVAGRLLVQHLGGGHQLALFGGLDAVGHADHAGTGTNGLEQRQTQLHPADGEPFQIEPLAVEQMQEAVVCHGT